MAGAVTLHHLLEGVGHLVGLVRCEDVGLLGLGRVEHLDLAVLADPLDPGDDRGLLVGALVGKGRVDLGHLHRRAARRTEHDRQAVAELVGVHAQLHGHVTDLLGVAALLAELVHEVGVGGVRRHLGGRRQVERRRGVLGVVVVARLPQLQAATDVLRHRGLGRRREVGRQRVTLLHRLGQRDGLEGRADGPAVAAHAPHREEGALPVGIAPADHGLDVALVVDRHQRALGQVGVVERRVGGVGVVDGVPRRGLHVGVDRGVDPQAALGELIAGQADGVALELLLDVLGDVLHALARGLEDLVLAVALGRDDVGVEEKAHRPTPPQLIQRAPRRATRRATQRWR